MISERLRVAIKLSKRRQYQLAWQAGIHPCLLSKIVNGIERVRPGDRRVLAIGSILGIARRITGSA